jgi:hypothetical protein
MAGKPISLDQAKTMIKRYHNDRQIGTIKGGKFSKDEVLSILNLEKCTALRFYFARNDSAENTIVLVGEDATGTLLTDDVMLDAAPPCPPYCPTNPID